MDGTRILAILKCTLDFQGLEPVSFDGTFTAWVSILRPCARSQGVGAAPRVTGNLQGDLVESDLDDLVY